jgi:hypothetical protein
MVKTSFFIYAIPKAAGCFPGLLQEFCQVDLSLTQAVKNCYFFPLRSASFFTCVDYFPVVLDADACPAVRIAKC